MSVAEAEVRMTALRAREKSHDLSYWMESFLSHLSQAPQDGVLTAKVPICYEAFKSNYLINPKAETKMDKIRMEDIGDMLGKYMQPTGWTKLCLLLDYDG